MFAWLAGKGKRAALRADQKVDQAVDATVDQVSERLHTLVAGKLSGDSSLVKLTQEASLGAAEPLVRTQTRVALALEDAADQDPEFAAALMEVVRQLQNAYGEVSSGDGGVSVGGNLQVQAGGGSFAAAVVQGDVSFGNAQVPQAYGPRLVAPGVQGTAAGGKTGWSAVTADRGGISIGSAGPVQVTYQQRVALGQPVRLDPRIGQVTGRERLLEDLHTRLSGTQGVGIVALCGLGGVGKTTTALEHAYRYLPHYEIVWFFHAEQATDLLAQFHELAELLEAAGSGNPVGAVHAALAAHPGRWLLVFDNVKDYAAARSWLPAKGSGHVLVTTQDGHWPREQVLEVFPLDALAAVDFLLDRTMSNDLASAQAIARELGLLPLALAQAAAFVETTGRSLEQYLGLLRTSHNALLARGAPTAHATPVVATWSLALAELEASSPGSLILLRLAVFLAPEDIPFRLLLPEDLMLSDEPLDADVVMQVRSLCAEALALDDAVAGLRRHSLIGPPSEVFSVHRLVQIVTRDQIVPDEREAWLTVVRALVEAAVPEDPTVRAAWPTCRLLLPHAALVADLLGMPMRRLVTSLSESGDYATARAWWQTLAQAHEDVLGPENSETLTVRANFARSTGEAGEAVKARDLFLELLAIRERVSGPEHHQTLTVRADLGYWTGEAGDPAKARDLYQELLPVRAHVSGPEHPETLTISFNVARWTGQAGDAVKARDLFLELLPVRERVSGPEHPETLTVAANLAFWTGRAGEPAKARDRFLELLPVREQVSGPEHPESLTIAANVARWTGEAGDAVKARDLFLELLPISESVLGTEHPGVLASRADLGYWTGEAGDPAKARDLYQELLPVRERVSGPEHPETLAVRANLARLTAEAGDPAKARDLYQELLRIRAQASGSASIHLSDAHPVAEL
ncbi:tetratricopeptide repeat protein [Catenulispora sp. GAS73]|uniref:tetratricopeptide repeat protein n=1 Tax=Catenulispora sp. GAS73 TaxID=3156269 RepID=UPI003517F1F5